MTFALRFSFLGVYPTFRRAHTQSSIIISLQSTHKNHKLVLKESHGPYWPMTFTGWWFLLAHQPLGGYSRDPQWIPASASRRRLPKPYRGFPPTTWPGRIRSSVLLFEFENGWCTGRCACHPCSRGHVNPWCYATCYGDLHSPWMAIAR